MTVKVFALMGALTAIAAVIASARLGSAGSSLGELDELRVIAAAVIGGTALAGGVGTIYGAILGRIDHAGAVSGMGMVGVRFTAAEHDRGWRSDRRCLDRHSLSPQNRRRIMSTPLCGNARYLDPFWRDQSG